MNQLRPWSKSSRQSLAQPLRLEQWGLGPWEADKLEGDDFNCKVLKGSVLPFMLLKALQEATARIEALEASNADLAARLTALKTQP